MLSIFDNSNEAAASDSNIGRSGLRSRWVPQRGGFLMSQVSKPVIITILCVQMLLALVLVTQFIVIVFWSRDSLTWEFVELFEIAVMVLAIVTLIVGGYLIRVLFNRNQVVEDQLQVASGAFHDLLTQKFKEWGLTDAEADVALLSVKGMTIAEIASIRNTSEGTVKAQSNALFKKAGVSNRTQLLSLFLEELITGVNLQNDAA